MLQHSSLTIVGSPYKAAHPCVVDSRLSDLSACTTVPCMIAPVLPLTLRSLKPLSYISCCRSNLLAHVTGQPALDAARLAASKTSVHDHRLASTQPFGELPQACSFWSCVLPPCVQTAPCRIALYRASPIYLFSAH